MNPQLSTLDSPRRILVRGVNWLGDAVMTTPALLRLRARFPEAHIALLTPAKLRDLWLQHPAINETIAIGPDDGLASVGRKLRGGNYEVALVLPNSPRSALEVWLAKIPRRVGYARPWRNWFLTQAIPTRPGHARMHKRSGGEIKRLVASTPVAERQTPESSAHQMHEYLHLTAVLGANPEPTTPTLVVTQDEIETAKKKFGLENITGPILGLNPGAEYGPAKRWPADRFIAAAQEIQKRTNCIWLLFGGAAERARAEHIATALRASAWVTHNLAGQTSLRELMALFNFCRVLLTNDSGPMHVAAALGTPVVVPFGSTSPELTGPGLPADPRHRILKGDAPCAPCFLRACPIDFRCMNGISVERVVEAVIATLNR